ncbi:uncharacterized protein LOC119633869 [Glossina fuscipes]|uniref:Uncharacterized protein LOC119633869 n=1 Tax=Glossina fuscipes TaxID=7396 RepID=A0A8U0WEN8_9MUSC|nr:uncharacterized protein LOC119633869 [Glossina fuscipes]KAI9585739.1 hypothetical protein GQX74_001586 [Glossina fuscipes]
MKSRSESAKIGSSAKSPNKLSKESTKQTTAKRKASTFKEKLSVGRLTKKQKTYKNNLRASSKRKIPRNKLTEALEMLRNSDHEIWKDENISCNPSIHRCYETNPAMTSTYVKLQYARQCLLRRDWENLIKILTISTVDEKESRYYPLFVKYAALCLAHIDSERFNSFTTLITDSEPEKIIKKCTELDPKIET